MQPYYLTASDRAEWVTELSALSPYQRTRLANHFGLTHYPDKAQDLLREIEAIQTAKGMADRIDRDLKDIFKLFYYPLNYRGKDQNGLSETERQEWIAELSELTPWERQQIGSFFSLSTYPEEPKDMFIAIELKMISQGRGNELDSNLRNIFNIHNLQLKYRGKSKVISATPSRPTLTPSIPTLTPSIPTLTPSIPTLTPSIPTLTPSISTTDASKIIFTHNNPQHVQVEWIFVSSGHFWTLDIILGLHAIELIAFFRSPVNLIVSLDKNIQFPKTTIDNSGRNNIQLPYSSMNEDAKIIITSRDGINHQPLIHWLTAFKKFVDGIKYNVNESS